MNRGAQCAIASVVRSSGIADRGLKAGAQISQQDHRRVPAGSRRDRPTRMGGGAGLIRSEEHTSELQSQSNLVCRLLLEKKKKKHYKYMQLQIHQLAMACIRISIPL